MGFKSIASEGICWLVSWMWAFGLLAFIIYMFWIAAAPTDMLIAAAAEICLLSSATWVISRVV